MALARPVLTEHDTHIAAGLFDCVKSALQALAFFIESEAQFADAMVRHHPEAQRFDGAARFEALLLFRREIDFGAGLRQRFWRGWRCRSRHGSRTWRRLPEHGEDVSWYNRANAVVEAHDRFARRIAQFKHLAAPEKRMTDDGPEHALILLAFRAPQLLGDVAHHRLHAIRFIELFAGDALFGEDVH